MDINDLFGGIAEAYRQYQAEMVEQRQALSNPIPDGLEPNFFSLLSINGADHLFDHRNGPCIHGIFGQPQPQKNRNVHGITCHFTAHE